VILKWIVGFADGEGSAWCNRTHSRTHPTKKGRSASTKYPVSFLKAKGFGMTDSNRLPRRLLDLPMYLMLALTREGYRYAVKSGIQIRMTHYAIMATLAEFGPSSQKAVAEALGFNKSDVTKIINDLQMGALVQRLEDKKDNRRHRVTLTAKGRQQLEASDQELVASMKNFLRGLSISEYRQLHQLLLKAIQVHDERFISMLQNKTSTNRAVAKAVVHPTRPLPLK
jgi:DNA-binding MarR family transcriptional regulator